MTLALATARASLKTRVQFREISIKYSGAPLFAWVYMRSADDAILPPDTSRSVRAYLHFNVSTVIPNETGLVCRIITCFDPSLLYIPNWPAPFCSLCPAFRQGGGSSSGYRHLRPSSARASP